MCFLATAKGDNPEALVTLYEAAVLRGFHASHLSAFEMPNVDDVTGHLLAQDVVWVYGGAASGASDG